MNIYAASYLLPINGSPVAGGAVAVDNGVIQAVGTLRDIRKNFAASVQEFPGCVILPGLVNAHTHLELTDFPDWFRTHGSDTPYCSYLDWIIRVISIKRKVGAEAIAASLQHGLKLSLQNGTTMVGDILSERQLIPLYRTVKLSGRVYLEFIGQESCRYEALLAAMANDLDVIKGNFLPGLAPHAPFTVSETLLKLLLSAARSQNIPLTMHLSESAEEVKFFKDASGELSGKLYPFVGWKKHIPGPMGLTSTEWLKSRGALAPDFLAVHGVHLSPGDMKLLQELGVTLVLAPRSNHNLGVGKAPVKELLNAGVPLALGTDSLASNDSLSLWDEMRFLLDAFPQSFSPEDALRMATIGGAKAIKRDLEAGTLEPGKRADFIVMETEGLPESGRIIEQLMEDSSLQGVWCRGEKACSSESQENLSS